MSNDAGNKEEAKKASSYGKAVGLMVTGSTSMALMNVFAKAVSQETEITFWQMGVIRGLFMAIGCFIHAKCKGQSVFDIP